MVKPQVDFQVIAVRECTDVSAIPLSLSTVVHTVPQISSPSQQNCALGLFLMGSFQSNKQQGLRYVATSIPYAARGQEALPLCESRQCRTTSAVCVLVGL